MPILRAGISDKKGFTLIEVAMVLLILSVLMAAAAPRLVSFLSASKLETGSSRLATYLEHLRDEAVYKRKLLILRCRIEEGTFTVYSPAGEEEKAALMKPFDFDEDIRIVDIHMRGREKKSMGEVLISFLPGGMADNALIHIKDDEERQMTLELSPLSRKVEIHEGYLDAT